MYGWMQAIDEALVTSHLGVADKSDSYDTAKRKLDELIDWHIAVATDPRVNGGWQLVPLEPNEEMLDEGCESRERGEKRFGRNKCQIVNNIYEDMLAAAPKWGGE